MALHRLSIEMPLKWPAPDQLMDKWNEFSGLMRQDVPKHDVNVRRFYGEMALVANLHLLLLHRL